MHTVENLQDESAAMMKKDKKTFPNKTADAYSTVAAEVTFCFSCVSELQTVFP